MDRIKVNLRERSYDVLVGRDLLKDIGRFIRPLSLGEEAVIITNYRLRKIIAPLLSKSLVRAGIPYRVIAVADGEKSKSSAVLFRVVSRLAEYGRRKRLLVITLGGGVIGDLGGFAAAIYKRGVPYIQVPTSLLAQIDASIGGKVGVDLDCGKNLAGAFHQPRLVVCDTSLLKTLPCHQMINGISEAVKYGVIVDKTLFGYIEKNYSRILRFDPQCLQYLVSRCAAIKAKIVSCDERETKGLRAILNFGHTIGHALEVATGFKGYSHGYAVAVGMVVAMRISLSLGVLKNAADIKRIGRLLRAVGLPLRIKKGLNAKKIISAQCFDKKFIRGENVFVLIEKIGKAIVCRGVPLEAVSSSLQNQR
ncbi:MAG: 3-dehydroquinate synthase [Candidatus Omnitrophota bacterium]